MRNIKLSQQYMDYVATKHIQLRIEFPEYGLVNIPKFPETFWELNSTKQFIIAKLQNHKSKYNSLNHFRTFKSRVYVRLKKVVDSAFVKLKKVKIWD